MKNYTKIIHKKI